MELKICTTNEYPHLLDVLNEAFGFGETEFFQRELTHCTPYPNIATTSEIEHHMICVIDGQIVGALGTYPMDIVIGETNETINAYGVGQVCCLKQYRNRGVMTALMKNSAKRMHEEGRTIGFLTGDRRRYGHFGYDFGGSVTSYTLDKLLLAKHIAIPGLTGAYQDKNPRHQADSLSQGSTYVKRNCFSTGKNLTTRQAVYDDWHELNEAYQTMPFYVKRDARKWELHFKRTNLQWHIGECEGRKGYIAVKEPGTIVELYGDPHVLTEMLLDRANSLEEGKRLNITYATGINTPIGKLLYNTAAGISNRPVGLFAGDDSSNGFERLPAVWIPTVDYI